VGLEGIFLWNRVLWVAVGLGIFAFVFWRFRFSHAAAGAGEKRKKGQAEPVAARPAHARTERLVLPAATQHFGFGASLKQYLSEVKRSFRGIIWNRYFVAIAGAGLLFLVVSAGQVGKIYGTTTWPVTYEVVEILGGTFSIFMLILISFYAGELIWRERDLKIDQVADAMPVRTWVPFAGKLTALAVMVALLQGLILLAGIVTQAVKGYTHFELGLYLKALFGLQLVDYLLLCALVMLVHVLVNHNYMGHLVVVLYFVLTMFMGQMGLEHGLYQFGSDAGSTYSDMNGYGPFLAPFVWFKAYWAAWALLFAVMTNLFWVRGRENGRRWRIELARQRAGRPVLAAASIALVLIVGLGGFIFYNTNVLNDFRTSKQAQRSAVEYERLYKRYEGIAQPRVVGVKVQADLFPERRDAVLTGRYRLLNRSATPIDSVHVQLPRTAEIRKLVFTRAAERVLSDEERGYYIYRLAQPLAPGDSMALDFDLAYLAHGFRNKESGFGVAENGTFINSSLLPSFGYSPNGELGDDDTRRKYGLAPKERMAKQGDLKARQNNYISNDADWVDFEATVSTSPDQIAIAPGYLQKEWTEGGRRYFHYTMDAPILNFYSFLSARYEVKKDSWTGPDGQPVAIEIYYHPGHEYNLERMVEGVKKSLAYFTESFGPYQHRQVRILEFPRYASFAQSFPNTIPYSEAIGFIARIEDPEKDIDYPFYVTAHEVAHQWWAHQVIGANVQGATLLSETLSQYSALMVMEKEYGQKQMKRFLKYELDRYLTGRSFERKKEQPLALNENQQYIHYQKGSVAMYALKDYLGEERLNGAIAAFLKDKKFQQPPYTTSGEFVEYLRAATPDSLQGVITDLLETITLWDNRAKSATSRKLPDGRYEVTLQVEAHKVRADSLGNEHEVPMNDLVDVGVYGVPAKGKKEGELLYLEKHRVRAGAQQIRVVVDAEPARAGIDPLNKLIDRHSNDNVVKVQDSGFRIRDSGGNT
jgi:hypothetical protein